MSNTIYFRWHIYTPYLPPSPWLLLPSSLLSIMIVPAHNVISPFLGAFVTQKRVGPGQGICSSRLSILQFYIPILSLFSPYFLTSPSVLYIWAGSLCFSPICHVHSLISPCSYASVCLGYSLTPYPLIQITHNSFMKPFLTVCPPTIFLNPPNSHSVCGV